MSESASLLWTPSSSRIEQSRLTGFARFCEQKTGRNFASYAELHAWSVDEIAGFWDAIWEYCEVLGVRGDTTLLDADKMPGARFFPNAEISFAENMLRNRGISQR